MEVQLAGNPGQATSSHRQPSPYLIRHSESSPDRRLVEAFIAGEYAKHFGAELSDFMPTLISMHGPDGGLTAAVGYRAAVDGPLFLETYTKGSVEDIILRQTGCVVPRDEIVEVGSLACRGGKAAMDVVRALVPALIGDGFSWVVFTGADTIRNVFRRLHLKPVALCIANKSLLGERRHQWGTYYDHNPIVMAGRIADGMSTLDTSAVAS
jgi:hypothetical protein